MALILTEPGLTATVHPPSFNKFRMSGGVDGQPVDCPPHTGQSAAYPAAYYSAHPELVEGWQRVEGWPAAARQPIPVETTTGGEGAV